MNDGPITESVFVRVARSLLRKIDKSAETRSANVVALAIVPTEPSLTCLNCGVQLSAGNQTKLYCQQMCADTAEFVRYVRRCRRDDRVEREDILEAIGVQLIMLYSGGYPRAERKLTEEERTAILLRDQSTCMLCGGPATEIDHIDGDSRLPDNLRALCRACNLAEAAKRLTSVTDPAVQQRISRFVESLAQRIVSRPARLVCDDDLRWPKVYQSIMKQRRELLREVT